MYNPDPDEKQYQRELAIERYISAYDRGDWQGLAEVVKQALHDPELDRLLVEINAALYAETGLPLMDESTEQVYVLLRQHLPSGFTFETPEESLVTVGDVAERLESERLRGKPILAGDAQANQQLMQDKRPLPSRITPDTLPNLAQQLRVVASERYWELFRRAALALRMSRESRRVSLAAARRQRGQRRGRVTPSKQEPPEGRE